MILYDKILWCPSEHFGEPYTLKFVICASCIAKHLDVAKSTVKSSKVRLKIATHPLKGSFKVTKANANNTSLRAKFRYQKREGVAHHKFIKIVGNRKIVYVKPTLIKE